MAILIQFVMKGMAWKMNTNKGGNWLIVMASEWRPVDDVDSDSDSNGDINSHVDSDVNSDVDSDSDSDSDVDVVYCSRMHPCLD